MLLHKRCWWSRCSRPQGRRRTWCNESGTTHAEPPRTHTHTVITMTAGISDPVEIAEVDGIRYDPETPQHNDVQRWCSLTLRSPLGGHARGRWERGGGGVAHQEEERRSRGLWRCCTWITS
jgi:hypothetical protein